MNLPIASGYLMHLQMLEQEARARFLNVPPFQFLLLLAAFTHIAFMVPIIFAKVSDEVPPLRQVHLVFGIDKEEKSNDLKAKLIQKPSAPPADMVQKQAAPPENTPEKPKSQVVSAKAVKEVMPTTASIEEIAPPPPQLQNVMANPERANVAPIRHTGVESRSRQGGVYMRQNNPQAGGEGAAISKYEQLLSGWINSHRLNKVLTLPAGIGGRTIVRVRINRRGYVIFKTIEQSSGSAELDQTAIDTVSRASPVPAVPAEYPGGAQLEFLIPISFVVN
jgi:TonB family protein